MHTYEIKKIAAKNYGMTGFFLTVEDLRGNKFEKARIELQRDRRIWDLLYNGILHSIANGASVDEYAQELLQIPVEAKKAKYLNWKAGKEMPNWPEDLPMPDPDDPYLPPGLDDEVGGETPRDT